MAEQETILTEEGLKKLEDELDYLRSEKRPVSYTHLTLPTTSRV